MANKYINGWKKYDYYEWLVEKVNCQKSENHTRLLHTLHSIPFHIVLERDSNRARDGIYLRTQFYNSGSFFIDETVPVLDPALDPCTVLEMMIAMAERFCLDVIGFQFKSTADWFWYMIENLGFKHCTDDDFDDEEVYSKVQNMMNRNYKPDGRGGMFPLAHPTEDQRHVELWYQLSEWYDERYGDMLYDES